MAEQPGRDREATAARLLVAAREVLEAAGGEGFGVNAVARRAGCDKQLIYRYYGGRDGLLEALGAEIGARLAAALAPALVPPPATYRAFALALARALLAAYRADPLLVRVRAWEFGEGAAAIAPLAAAQGRALAEFVRAARPAGGMPAGVDAPAVNALIIGAVEAAVLAARASGRLAGLALVSEADWARAEAALASLVEAVYPVP